jgi:hypothetical protein
MSTRKIKAINANNVWWTTPGECVLMHEHDSSLGIFQNMCTYIKVIKG